ncbi:hypothetical protein [Carboxylicivirga taeanensis]|uniref:hypothetical protein n=1 Tax=Carboxylicivirga taeanensis TaxID=1416875 RepID=UPI003F6DA61B
MNQQEAFDLLNEQLQDIPKVQIRSMSLAVLPRLMNTLDRNHDTCTHCKKFSAEGEIFVRDIRPLFEQNISTIKKFEQWVDEAQKHLTNAHQQQVKGRITSTYTAVGMGLGIAIAAAYSLLAAHTITITSISLGWAIGMLTGFIAGKIKENKLNQNKKLY